MARRNTVPLVLTFLLLVGSGAGCTATLSHPDVDNPVVLGDRLHVGDPVQFERSEILAKYRVSAGNSGESFGSPGGGIDEKWDDATPTAQAGLHLSRFRAIVGTTVRARSMLVFLVVGGRDETRVDARGEVVEVVPVAAEASGAAASSEKAP